MEFHDYIRLLVIEDYIIKISPIEFASSIKTKFKRQVSY